MLCVVVAYVLTSSDMERKIFGSKLTIFYQISKRLDYNELVFFKVLLRFTRTCTTYITIFDVKFEHSNLQRPFCELLSHTTSLYLIIFVTGSYKQ